MSISCSKITVIAKSMARGVERLEGRLDGWIDGLAYSDMSTPGCIMKGGHPPCGRTRLGRLFALIPMPAAQTHVLTNMKPGPAVLAIRRVDVQDLATRGPTAHRPAQDPHPESRQRNLVRRPSAEWTCRTWPFGSVRSMSTTSTLRAATTLSTSAPTVSTTQAWCHCGRPRRCCRCWLAKWVGVSAWRRKRDG
eukprot:365884-Chlamydomonas_euryale.AAC.10